MTLLAAVVTASTEVAGTSSRSRKVAVLAELLRSLEPEEIAPAVGFLSGAPRQWLGREAEAAPGRAARPRYRGGGRLRQAPLHRGPASGSACRADGRRDR